MSDEGTGGPDVVTPDPTLTAEDLELALAKSVAAAPPDPVADAGELPEDPRDGDADAGDEPEAPDTPVLDKPI